MTSRPLRGRAITALSLTVGLALVLWALMILVAGGNQVQYLGVKLSTAHPILLLIAGMLVGCANRPARGILAAGVRYAAAPPASAAAVAGALAIAAALWTSVHFASAVAGGADSYGYLSQARLWREGALVVREPIAAQSPWPFAIDTWTPLGYRPTAARDAIVPVYPPGLPLIMAAMDLAFGKCGALYVVPLSAALVVALTFLLARRVFDATAVPVWSALLMASTPVFLYQSVSAMSDVPATAALTLALWLSAADWPFAAGLAVAAAVAIRPNLAFAALPIAVWTAARSRRRAIRFCAGVAPAVVGLAVFNARLYGSPFTFGYGRASEFYAVGNFATNAEHFTRWAVEGQTPLVLAGAVFLLAPAAFAHARIDRARLLLGGSAAAILASYLFYEPYGAWWFLRFLLPMWPVLMIGAAAAFDALARWRSSLIWQAAAVVAIALMVGRGVTLAADRYAFDLWRGERRFVDVAAFIRDYTEPDAVVLAFQHSGSIRYYASRLTLRWDVLEPARLDEAVSFLAANGRHPYIVLDGEEVGPFRSRFIRTSRLGALAWTPVAVLVRPEVRVYDALNREPTATTNLKGSGTGDAHWRCDAPLRSAQNLQH